MNPITSIVLHAMVDAAQNVKLSTLSMGAARQARARESGDSGPDSAAYANTLSSAIQSGQASQMALMKAQTEVQAQESIREQQLQQEAQAEARRLDRERRRRALEEATVGAADESQEDEGKKDSGEAGASVHDGSEHAAPKHGGESAAPPSPDGGMAKGVLYTPRGTVKGKPPENTLTYTA
jgi:hypothetical protein